MLLGSVVEGDVGKLKEDGSGQKYGMKPRGDEMEIDGTEVAQIILMGLPVRYYPLIHI